MWLNSNDQNIIYQVPYDVPLRIGQFQDVHNSPTAETEERARSEFSEAIHGGAPHVLLDIKGSKLQRPVISKPVVKRNPSQRKEINTQVPLS